MRTGIRARTLRRVARFRTDCAKRNEVAGHCVQRTEFAPGESSVDSLSGSSEIRTRKEQYRDKNEILVLFALATVGLLVAQVVPQVPPGEVDSSLGQEWELVPGAVAGWAGSAGGSSSATVEAGWAQGEMFLYNMRTGKVYKYFYDCGQSAPSGCFGVVPVLEEPAAKLAVTPRPQSGGSLGNPR